MSRENVEIVRTALALLSSGSPEAAASGLDLFDPEAEIQDHPGLPDQEWHNGYQGLRSWAAKLWQVLGDLEVVPSEFVEAPDGRLVMRLDVTATGKGSGVPVDLTAYGVVTFRDARVVRAAVFSTKADAVEAVGLTE